MLGLGLQLWEAEGGRLRGACAAIDLAAAPESADETKSLSDSCRNGIARKLRRASERASSAERPPTSAATTAACRASPRVERPPRYLRGGRREQQRIGNGQ